MPNAQAESTARTARTAPCFYEVDWSKAVIADGARDAYCPWLART